MMMVVCLTGCEQGLVEGILIGAGTSKVASEGQKLAQQEKAALVEKILELRQQLENTEDPNEMAVLKNKLQSYEKQKEIADITAAVADKVNEGLQKDWATTDPQKQEENYEWIAGTAGAALLWLLQKRKNSALVKGISRIESEADPEKAKEIHDTIKHYTNKIIA
jgi:hypothetical protein